MNKFMIGAVAGAFLLAGCQGKTTGEAAGGDAGAATQITGAGSTFVYPVLSAWSADYSKETGTKINYQSIGSGGGISQIKAGTVDFGATDKPLDPKELAESGLAQFPVIVGGVVAVVNIDGIDKGKLKLTGPLLADIYLGKVSKWDDPAIVKLNPGLKLPDAKITAVHRSDGSGTTFNFTYYLSQVSPAWKAGPGADKSVNWNGGVGGKGNEGVAAYVNQIKNSIGYVEYAYVLQNNMAWAYVQNAAGNYVAPSADSFKAAAASADWTKTKDFYLVMTNAPGDQAYPITASTFVLMPREPKNQAASDAALKFFKWSLENGQPQADKLDYVPLPATLVKQIEDYMQANIK
ncbi:phosphate ABC transporter substrate-binding protein PstS [Tsuneonella mangrovi]|uniref:phosphate ABC transporter substrate-binding protein PstS n=1 Tax=Tsuneonella mangrovi TaxID=1982042 RepID=UPI00196B4115|nr:phosphate ABC transporter substrate-binding protein PstS [Tsuneonella mangrovi]